jgi:PIN domain nuclease of toxin-antitoxin system
MLAFAKAVDWHFLPLTEAHAAGSLIQPLEHKDPFDELLLVQAQQEDMRLLTRDVQLVSHPFAVSG